MNRKHNMFLRRICLVTGVSCFVVQMLQSSSCDWPLNMPTFAKGCDTIIYIIIHLSLRSKQQTHSVILTRQHIHRQNRVLQWCSHRGCSLRCNYRMCLRVFHFDEILTLEFRTVLSGCEKCGSHKLHRRDPHLMREPRLNSLQSPSIQHRLPVPASTRQLNLTLAASFASCCCFMLMLQTFAGGVECPDWTSIRDVISNKYLKWRLKSPRQIFTNPSSTIGDKSQACVKRLCF